MNKKKLFIAKNAIRKIAERDGVTVEYVRTQLKIAMISGLSNSNPKVREFWESIPHENNVPTPEEFIIYTSEVIKRKGFV